VQAKCPLCPYDLTQLIDAEHEKQGFRATLASLFGSQAPAAVPAVEVFPVPADMPATVPEPDEPYGFDVLLGPQATSPFGEPEVAPEQEEEDEGELIGEEVIRDEIRRHQQQMNELTARLGKATKRRAKRHQDT
jgi:hypothetical protein